MSINAENQSSYSDYPASYNQKPLWFFSQLEPDSPTYNTVRGVRLLQKIDFSAARRALQRIVDRHEPLRTTFHIVDGELIQRVHNYMPVDMSVVDVQGLSKNEIDKVIRQEMVKPFDLKTDSLLRFTFFQEAEDHNIALINMHHIATDLWSFALFIHESDAFYNEELGGTPVNLKPIRNPYRLLDHKQRTVIEGEKGDLMWEYWRKKLVGELPRLELPTDRQRSNQASSLGRCANLYFDPSMVEGLRRLAETFGTTLQAVVLAAFKTLLYRYTGQTDLLIGYLKANRTIQASRLIGYFVNPVVLRSDLGNQPSFQRLLEQVDATLNEGLEHGTFPFSLLVERLMEADPETDRLELDVMFAWQKTSRLVDANTLASFALNSDGTKMKMSAYEIESKHLKDWISPFDLTLLIAETDENLMGVVEYSSHLFNEETIERMVGHFKMILQSALDNPSCSIGEMPMLLPTELQALQDANQNKRMARPDETIHAPFEKQAAERPNQIAIIQPATEESSASQMTYDRLNRLSNRVAHELLARGVVPDQVVGVAIPKTTNLLVGLLGILKAGGAYLPLDPTYPADHLDFIIEDSGVKLILTEADIWEKSNWEERVTPIFLGDLAPFAHHPEGNPCTTVTSDDLAYVIYTSGSTGRPKGVMLNHRSVVNHNASVVERINLSHLDRVLQFATINFDTAVEEIFPTLRCGATLVLRPGGVPALHEFTDLINEYKISILDLPTGYWHVWVNELSHSDLKIPASVRVVIVGGEKALSPQLAQWQMLTADRNICWLNTYGPTETTVIATWWQLPTDGQWNSNSEIPIGQALPNVSLYLLDPFLNPVPVGVTGELYVGGDAVGRGYLGRPDLTESRFVPDTFSNQPDARMYKTGDLVRRLPDGNLLFLGRADNQVKIRGFRVEPDAIEAILVSHPAIESATVIPFSSKRQGTGLSAYVVLQHTDGVEFSLLSPEEIKAYLSRTLPNYMIPENIQILDELPLLPNGKLNRRALLDPFHKQKSTRPKYVAPRSPIEREVVAIWEEYLHHSPISVFDSFFELGGQSLLATQIISRIRNQFQIELPVRTLFEAPTVAGVAHAIEEAETSEHTQQVINPIERNQALPLSFAQQRLWFIDQLDPQNPAYNLPTLLELTGEIQQDIFETVLRVISERHEALRTRFVMGDEGPVQEILSVCLPETAVIDLTNIGSGTDERRAEAIQLAQGYALEPFDLQSGPLWRIHLMKIAPELHLLFINMHHMITDGWSYGVLVHEVGALYGAFVNGDAHPLTPLSVQFADYAAWQQEWLNEGVLQTQLDYWTSRLSGAPPLLALPTDFSRPPLPSSRGGAHYFELPAELTDAVKRYAVENGASLFMALMAAYQLFLSRYSGQGDILVGTPVANRLRPELEPMIGMFVNTLVIRADCRQNLTFDELVAQVKEAALEAYAHQDVPFEQLVQRLDPNRDMSFNPIFQVMFVLNNAPLEKLELPELAIERVLFDAEISNFDLSLIFEEIDGRLKGKFEFSTDLFKAETVAQMASHFERLLTALVAKPTVSIKTHPILLEGETSTLLSRDDGACFAASPVDRANSRIHFKGFQINPAEIETVIRQLERVDSAAVVVNESEQKESHLVAYVGVNSTALSVRDVRSYLQKQLPGYKVPTVLVLLPELPLRSDGSVNRDALPAPEWEQHSAVEASASQSVTEKIMIGIWSELLNVETVNVGDNFFELGGHSLLATQLMSRVRSRLHVELAVRTVFEAATLREFAERVDEQAQLSDGPTITPVSRDGHLPLSFAQQRLWFLDQLEPNSPAYNVPEVIRVTGQIDLEALDQALQTLVDRHEILRTTFQISGEGQPSVKIAETLEAGFSRVDLTEIDEAADRERLAKAEVDEEMIQPFDLHVGPLFRATLIQLTEEEQLILLVIHHSVTDGWSSSILVDELTALYTAYVAGDPSPLAPLSLQYLDFAVWQRGWLLGEQLDGLASYWTNQLDRLPPLLKLPTDFNRPPEQTYNGATYHFELSPRLSEQVYAFCRHENVTPFMALLAIFQALLGRYAQTEHVPVGTPIANRNRVEVEQMIGFFVNTLVLRGDLAGKPSFRELIGRTREVTLDAYAHQDLPFETLVDLLDLARDIAYNPIFQVMFALQNVPNLNLELPGVTFSSVELEMKSATFDLSLFFEEGELGDGKKTFFGLFEYNTDLFKPDTIKRMASHFEMLLGAALQAADKPLATLPLLTPAEEQLLLRSWNEHKNDSLAILELEKPVHYRFEQLAAERPNTIAVKYGDQHLSYGELNRRSNQLARHLQAQGVKRETVVGICHERSVHLLVAVLGVLKAGGAYLPINPNQPDDRVRDLVTDSAIDLLLTQSSQANRTPFASLATVQLDLDWELISHQAADNLLHQTDPADLAYMIYTSGSTGRPKGVMIEHRNLSNAFVGWNEAFELADLHVHLQMANFAFDVFTGDWVRALCSGATLILCPHETLLDPEGLYQLMLSEQVEAAEFVPAILRSLIDYMDHNGQVFDNLKLLSCGSDVWYAGEYKRFLEYCGPETRLINSFGLTESTIDSSYYERDGSEIAGDQIVPIGRPFANIRFYILDEQMQPTPIGVPGELYVGGRGVGRGYHNRPELTAERFLKDPFVADVAARIYKTGDQARYLADGNVELVGRLDHQLKIRGFRVEPGEIEAVIEQHPSVRASAVLGKTAVGGQRLVAYLVAKEPDQPSPTELKQFLQARLPDYMVPSLFVFVPNLPLSANGKINRDALPEPNWGDRFMEEVYTPPRGETEQCLAEIWSSLLGVKPVGRYDNFFDLGGHSILAMRFTFQVRDRLAVSLPVARLFDHQTIAELAELIEQQHALPGDQPLPPLERLPSGRPAPLSFSQQRLWLVDQLEPGTSYYNLPLGVRLTGLLDVAMLEEALNLIIARHAILRTTYHLGEEAPYQMVQPVRSIGLERLDKRHLSEETLALEIEKLQQKFFMRPFDLTQDQMVRAQLIQTTENDYHLLLTVHHIAFDGWSQGIFVSELTTIYDALVNGQTHYLPDLPVQYADFAAWQRNVISGELLKRLSTYWLHQLDQVPPLLELPTDRPRPTVQTTNGAFHHFSILAELTQALHKLSRAENVTLFMTLLAGFEILLARYSGQTDFCVGTPMANRPSLELEGLLGFFVNNLVMRADFSNEPSVREILQQVRKTALGGYAHQEMPFEMLVELINPRRDLSYAPLFQVLFTLDNTPAGSAIELDGLTLSPLDTSEGSLQFDIALALTERDGEIHGQLEYNSDLFDASTISRMVEHFQMILQNMTTDVSQSVHEIKMLTGAEEQYLLADLNQTDISTMGYPILPFHDLVGIHAASRSEDIAITFKGEALSYRELNERTNRLARCLHSRGVQPGSLVGISVERSADMVIGMLGILKAGCAFLPIDPNFPADRIKFMLADAELKLLLTQYHLVENKVLHVPDRIDVIFLDRDWKSIAREGADAVQLPVSADELAYVIYTSGSTGTPKGVQIEHRGYVNACFNYIEQIGLSSESRVLQVLSFGFDASLIEIGMTLLAGGTLCIPPQETVLSMSELHNFIQKERLTAITMTPSMLAMLPSDELPYLEAVISGGEALPSDILTRWGENRRFFNAYGPTETSIAVSMVEMRPGGPISIGRPFKNVQVYIVDDHLQPVPFGNPGELVIGGMQVGRGYLNRPELTTQKFIKDRFGPDCSGQLYRTGDLVRYQQDGAIAFLGRIDNQVKIRGYRIELGEIENAIRRHATIKECFVVVNEDVPGNKRLIAYLLLANGAEGAPADFRSTLQATLPDYMLPSLFVTLDHFPKLPNGKVDRKGLAERVVSRDVMSGTFVAPRNDIEQLVVDMVAELLKIDRVGIYDNFFELGGHSLLGTQLISRIRKQFEIELPLRKLFTDPTVAALSAEIKRTVQEKETANELADMVLMLDGLSEEDVKNLLIKGEGSDE